MTIQYEDAQSHAGGIQGLIQTRHGKEKLGLIGLLIARINEYETATEEKPTLIRLGENRRRTFREEARLLTTKQDTTRDDMVAGVRIVPASHPDDIIIESELE